MIDPGFGVYIHWPFCAAKCPYCDFNSHVRHQPVDQARYVQAFKAELAAMRARTGPRVVRSIFLGGGTPSLMEPATVGAILDAVSRHWTVPHGAEVTLEANPSSVEAERFRGYRAAGVNRVSLGVQALNDPDLRFLGRLHDVDQALHAIRLARETFPRLSFDLIYARPRQTVEAWTAELERAIALAADHLSLYQLTIEEGTRFHALHAAGKIVVPDADLAADLYEVTQAVTAARGLPAYEVSNHARPGAESRHNLIYWRYGEYVGVGPGAHGTVYRAWPPRRHLHREDTGDLARSGRNPGAWHCRRRIADTLRGGRRISADGPAAGRGHRPHPLRGAVGASARAQAAWPACRMKV